MEVLITGAAGFIGSHIAEAMLAAGREVRGLDSPAPAVHAERPSYWPAEARLIEGDVRDPQVAERARRGVGAVSSRAPWPAWAPAPATCRRIATST